MSEKNIAKTYDPKQVEDRLYAEWMEKGYFHAEIDKEKTPFTIVIPPPNITGQLHMGHALDETLQDILIRWKRMQGYCTLWLPGTDHASIATEAKIVEAMAKEGITKEDIGREKFLERAWEWKRHYGGRIVEQLKKLGCSCDWQRERFTMDEGLSRAVIEVFVRLYKKGLIYRGERIINWCPKCNTSISDAEVEYEEKAGHFWHIKYPVKDSDEFVVVATTRPETMLGDTAVAVHPEDERYKHLIGKTVVLPLMNREIPVIADEYVEKDFGTGVVKITPAHDPNDFEVGLRHNLPQIRVMNDDATMNELAGKYQGMDRYEARKQIVKDLEELGLLLKVEDHTHNVGTCYRCATVIEPLISKQWFVKMKPLAEPAIEVVKNGTIKFVPERFSKIYFNWMENIQDWCISRQLWWGHRIPAYYCQECGYMMVENEMPDVCPKCGSSRIEQDPDTLDTWFSSALWPFSTLGWPDETEDLKYFYPTDVLVTGYDIIFFWVARMIFSALEHTGKEPFKYVFIHGIVRDALGRKMSKSLGNGIDPLEIIDKYGTDALRFALTIGTSPGNDLRFSEEKAESSRNFANKIWNASRFVLMNFDDNLDFSKVDPNKFTTSDKWILSRVNNLTREVTENMEKFELGIALQKIYEFIWEEFCDWYIELVKPRLYDKDDETRLEAQYVLNYVLGTAMKLLHPYMPFITEEIYRHLVVDDESIMISKWPVYREDYNFPEEEKKMSLIMDAIKSIRNIRAEMNVPHSRKAKAIFVAPGGSEQDILKEGTVFFERLASCSEVVIQPDKSGIPSNAVAAILAGVEIFLPLEDLIDIEKEIERLEKELSNLQKELDRVNSKLANEGFVSKAPQKVVEEEKKKKEKYQEMYDKVVERLNGLKNKN
ncbi:valyl-tRNA synthetase [Acetivibrio thermocellus AD2]|jgi:valyl-tRNA synthetase|uniref:Valine--tRNA ligase n=1 Tax=Acetivibrio thermocellus AD2 TaxID=1138384 RepID=A0AB36TH15_ACETH|nr:valine--tRNA ligase [Acetivibrio thermocellus]CDG35000.1 Valine-tRNA ligase [Acetivibrio thermocellus BC1]ADU74953.1 valyl-tRNA synthetase [Acetivibrio thermocellus DSM 1313]ALX08914.1 Valyl-tRNA synthetase [Acetivibrio thermocellus AD2]ANV76664.1 Valyl-tRNA synthetase [Acetivibrio thermocellus DSM 2360]EIC05100.1 Valyl-tRNA synthetase [Acetivibrio thermocellus YS]